MKKLTREQVGAIFSLAVKKAYFWEKEGREEIWPDAVFAAIQELTEGEEEKKMKLTEARLCFKTPRSYYVEAHYSRGSLSIGFSALPIGFETLSTEEEVKDIERQLKKYLKEMGADLDEA